MSLVSIIVGQNQQQCQCRILSFVDTFVDKNEKIITFCRQTSPPVGNPKNVSTNPRFGMRLTF
ncbi:MAG TPA: hypothetical protein VKA40_11440 [Nitrososphaera sp.]|nr:hypothetical protein [Nitrososphaera sp.]